MSNQMPSGRSEGSMEKAGNGPVKNFSAFTLLLKCVSKLFNLAFKIFGGT